MLGMCPVFTNSRQFRQLLTQLKIETLSWLSRQNISSSAPQTPLFLPRYLYAHTTVWYCNLTCPSLKPATTLILHFVADSSNHLQLRILMLTQETQCSTSALADIHSASQTPPTSSSPTDSFQLKLWVTVLSVFVAWNVLFPFCNDKRLAVLTGHHFFKLKILPLPTDFATAKWFTADLPGYGCILLVWLWAQWRNKGVISWSI